MDKHSGRVSNTSRYGAVIAIPMKDIVESPFQVRMDYGNVQGLAQNIQEKGLLEPILVRPKGNKVEIVHGHRRYKAVELLGWLYIDGFSKDLTDSEAIIIQGSENIWRKDYTAIEEAHLYHNYRMFLEKESKQTVTNKQVADAFHTSMEDVRAKIDLLELPKELQAKIQSGELPYTKARQLTILLRESTPIGVDSIHAGEPRHLRTDKFFSEIKRLSEEIEEGGLKTEKAISAAASAIRDGKDYDDAVQKAKVNEAVELAQKDLRSGKSPEDVLKSIAEHQTDPKEVLEATREANIELLKRMLIEKLVVCPHCGNADLMWACKQELLVKNGQAD